MTNAEFYKDEIKNFKGTNFCNEFIKPIVRNWNCNGTDCHYCNIHVALWLMEEHKEHDVDWENVPVDTPILVKDYGKYWKNRYFAGYINGKVLAWDYGATGWSGAHTKVPWKYAKLWEGSEEQAAEKRGEQ